MMTHEASIDVAVGEEPRVGEQFYINLQENSEMLGLLDGGRTFRFKSASAADKNFMEENRMLKVVKFTAMASGATEARSEGQLTYTE